MTSMTPQQLVREYQFRFKKRFGQNFISDKNLLDSIARDAHLDAGDWVIEIGPGLGTLTSALAAHVERVIAVEVDRDLVAILSEHPPGQNVTVVEGDALAMDWNDLLRVHGWKGQPVKVAANLPYYITTPLVMKALEETIGLTSVTAMVQQEVAERMVAKPGDREAGILSLIVQYFADPEICRIVPAAAFYPKPEVNSAIVHLRLHPKPAVDAEKSALFDVIRAGFSQRRKKFRNSLKQLLKAWNVRPSDLDDVLASLGIDEMVRAEELSLVQFGEITQALMKHRTEKCQGQ